MRRQSLGRVTVAAGAIILAAASLSAQSGPVLGYVVESPRLAMRAILGIPGAARFSDPLPLPSSATNARVAPGQAYALIERALDDPAILPLDGVTAGQAAPIPQALRVADFVAFSPNGSSAVLYSAAAGRLQVIAGLPAAPRIAQDVDAGSLPGQPAAAAVSDDAGSVLLASAGGVDLLLPGGLTQRILSVATSAALAFFPNSARAAIADRGAGSLYMFQRTADGVSTALLATGLPALDEIGATADGQGLIVANSENRSIGFVNAQTGEMQTVTLPTSPARLDRLANRNAFLVAAEPGQPAWIVNRDHSEVLATFVPALPAVPATRQRSIRRPLEER